MPPPPPTQPLLLHAFDDAPMSRPPVWLMRQAGRYMAEYRAVREKVGFLDLCKSPDLATEVSLQPWHAFGMDAVIMFCDILVPCEAMGMALHFGNGGPKFEQPIRTAEAIHALSIPDPQEKTGFVMNLLRQLRRELQSSPQTALIGFAGAPWTLAAYMVEGGVSKDFTTLRCLRYNEPDLLHTLLGKLAQTVTAYLTAQIEAGAHVVQLFDTWGGILSDTDTRTFILPYQQQVIAALKANPATRNTPVMLYVNGSNRLLETMAESGADGLSLDWMTPLADARVRLTEAFPERRIVLQGNLDPAAMLTRPEVLRPLVAQTVADGGDRHYIFNVGHGLVPATPPQNVQQVVSDIQQQTNVAVSST